MATLTPTTTATGTIGSSTALTSHIADLNNPHAVTATQVGLGNVDNTADINKPVSTATTAALVLKEGALGSPTTTGYVLSSSPLGVRSWVPNGGGGTAAISNTNQAIANTITQGVTSNQQLQVDTTALRSVVFNIVGAYINEVTAALSPLAKLSGFGVSFGTADGTVVSTTGGFGYDFGNFFGTYVTSVSATPITVTPSNRGAAAAYYFAQV